MKVCVVLVNVPDVGRGGGGNRASGLLEQLRLHGHEVHLVSVIGKHAGDPRTREAIERVSEMGISVYPVPYIRDIPGFQAPYSLRSMFETPEDFFCPYEKATRAEVTKVVRDIAPDCVFSFSIDPLVYVQELGEFPVLSVLSETMNLNMRVQLKYGPPVLNLARPSTYYPWIVEKLRILARERLDVLHGKKPTLLAMSGPHYVRWAKSKGISGVELFRTSAADGGYRPLRKEAPPEGATVLVIGHLHSTNNGAGLSYLFEHLLPALDRLQGVPRHRIRVVGAYDRVRPDLRKWLSSDKVEFAGPVTPADDEFRKADIVLVPVQTETGPRSRIISAFSYGSCVVAHSNNALGIPELVHGHNCLLGGNGRDLAEALRTALLDGDLRQRLAAEGRVVYEQFYSHEFAGGCLEKLLRKTVEMHQAKQR